MFFVLYDDLFLFITHIHNMENETDTKKERENVFVLR